MSLPIILQIVTLVVALLILIEIAAMVRRARGRNPEPKEDIDPMSTPKTDAAIERLKAALAADKNTAVTEAVTEAAAAAADTSDTEAAGKVDEITASFAKPAAPAPDPVKTADGSDSQSNTSSTLQGGAGDDNLGAS